jgi:hypothetical protein
MTKPFNAQNLPGNVYEGDYKNNPTRADFCNKVVAFVLSGFKPTMFPKTLYNVLMHRFGHIAHYDHGGFYHTWFSDDTQRLNWLRHVARGGTYGWASRPEEIALQNWVKESGLIAVYERKVADAIESSERAQLARLKAKYE